MIANRNMEVGQELPPITVTVDLAHMRLESGWVNRNEHTDWEIARGAGLDAPIAAGAMSSGYLCEMLTSFFGKSWLEGGKISTAYIALTKPGDILTARGIITKKIVEGSAVRFNCEVWVENQAGEKVTVGTASVMSQE